MGIRNLMTDPAYRERRQRGLSVVIRRTTNFAGETTTRTIRRGAGFDLSFDVEQGLFNFGFDMKLQEGRPKGWASRATAQGIKAQRALI